MKMKSKTVTVSENSGGISKALALTEDTAKNSGLDKKAALHLRLLAEELFGMLSGIAGSVEADYFIESDEKSFELHMKSDVKMTDEMHAQLLSVSKDGKNYAKKSFMGKIRVMIADFMSPENRAPSQLMMDAAMPYTMGSASADSAYIWSMVVYKNELNKRKSTAKEARDAWDELERSIVANIADDVKVKIIGSSVEIIVFKSFN